MQLMIRGDYPVATLRFFTFLPPDISVEVSRLVTTIPHLKEVIDVLCLNLNHYPTKPTSKA